MTISACGVSKLMNTFILLFMILHLIRFSFLSKFAIELNLYPWASEGFFSRGGVILDFSRCRHKNISRGPKVVKFHFFLFETKKKTFFAL